MNKVRRNVLQKAGLIVLVTVLLTSAIGFLDVGSFLYRASVLDLPAHQPFDGTVYPIAKSPDWVHLGDKRDYTYDQLAPADFQPLPFYDPTQLVKSADDLVWGNPSDDAVRNAKITYSTPYMGDYKLDGREYAGSHLAVDIKVPEGTPIFAIANGTVIKATDQPSGFGKHIVLVHNNVPGQSGPIYSSYSHNSKLLVTVGDVVSKGQNIALSGATGTATTPHLHFQIDNDEAPWHPFWPFTWKEAQDAGVSFFEAVNVALGQDRAIATTIHPLKFVQDHLGATASTTASTTASNSGYGAVSYVEAAPTEPPATATAEPVSEPIETNVVVPVETVPVETVPVEEAEVSPAPVAQAELNFVFDVAEVYKVGEVSEFSISLQDQYGNAYTSALSDEILIESVSGNVRVNGPIIHWSDFASNSELEKSFGRISHGRDRLKVSYKGEDYFSDWFNIFDAEKGFIDIPEGHKYYEAVMYLKDRDIVGGYSDGTYQAKRIVSRVEASKFIVAAAGLSIKNADKSYPFPDVIDGAWYLNYVFTLYDKGAINGNADGTLKPDNDVNKAEFLKMLFLAMGQDVRAAKPGEDWFVPYVEKAEDMEIMTAVDPGEGMTRGEVADAIWRLMVK